MPMTTVGEVGSQKLPQLADYELLEELGRGGMGVVYKARQKKLDRTVALKMILGGAFASADAVKRFELEAETAAKLDHSGIVPIYEIGQSDGNHFFSMKLVEGRSLADRLDEYQSDPRKSVELMIDIAQAVQHAHERGVLHRDLKPANILIDAEGNAAVTDLGLAKLLDDDSGLTQTGLVMGSPGFMSPEQAAGKSDVTTAVDIYSLGAVLYWLITGRPPFQAESRLEVILQTLDHTPESVRVYRPDADRDLNLICQKALQKSPRDRYGSVTELANDLQAWLDGDPLSVRPPTSFDLARNWIRKNFRTVAISLGAGVLAGLVVGMIILMVQMHNQFNVTSNYYEQLGDSEIPGVLRWFSWVKQVPLWLLILLPPFLVWMNVLIGIVTIWLIKPKSREVGMVAATSAALLAGIVAFTVSLGWAPITVHAIGAGKPDIELLSDALWMDDANEHGLARRALMQRYPGLRTLDTNQRGYLVRQKILTDQSLGVPFAMGQGILTTLCLTACPLFFATMLSGLIWDRGNRGGAYFGKSIELGIYSALFFLVMTKFVSNSVGTSPGLTYQLMTLAGIGFALYLGLTERRAVWRIAGFLVCSLSIAANFIESSHIHDSWRFAQNARTAQELQTATRYTEIRLAQTNDPWLRYQVALLAAYQDDLSRYEKACRELLSNFVNVHRPNAAEQIAKACLLKPESFSESEMSTVHELAEFASGYGSSADREWLFFARAMSEMRQGNLQQTQEWNRQCRDALDASELASRSELVASTFLVDALAFRSDGNEAEVGRCLDAASEVLKSHPNEDSDWTQRMVREILLEEIIGSKSFTQSSPRNQVEQ